MFNRIEEVNLNAKEAYRPSKTGLFLGLFFLLSVFLLLTYQLTRLNGSYSADSQKNKVLINDSIDFRNQEVVTNLEKVDRWTTGHYDLNGDALTVVVDGKTYKGAFVHGRKQFYLEVDQHKEYFTRQ